VGQLELTTTELFDKRAAGKRSLHGFVRLRLVGNAESILAILQ